MIKVFYGEERARALETARKFLGEDYEVVDTGELTPADLPTIFYGTTLFDKERRILLRDFLVNRAVAGELLKYLDTPHKVALLEMKVDKRAADYKELSSKVEFLEFKAASGRNFGAGFDAYRMAKRDGAKAVRIVESARESEEPMMFVGAMVSQALKDFAARPGEREKRALAELSKLDMQMKTGASQEPWFLIEAFLLKLAM